MNNSEYWVKRAEELEKAQILNESIYIEELKREYEKALNNIKKESRNWLARFSVNNQISMQEAKKCLNIQELKELKWDVNEYIKYGQENGIDLIWKKELENASAKIHISRLEALQIQIENEIEKLTYNENIYTENFIINTYKDSYYKLAYELQKGHNIGFQITALDIDVIKKVISKPWTTDNYTFSDRIWKNKTVLINTLKTELTQSIIRGKAPDEIIEKISKTMGVSKNRAGTLVMTESAFFSSIARKKCYNDLWVNEYDIVATLDSHTSDICRELDGKVFKMSEYKEGVTAPPFHIRCRSTTAPHFNDEFEFGERAARNNDGKIYYIPSNITYDEWYNKYVKKEVLTKNNLKNKSKDVKIKDIPNNANDFYKYILNTSNKEDFSTNKSDENGYITGQRLNSMLGYDSLPKKVSLEEFKRLSEESKFGTLYRGIAAETAEECQSYIDNFKNGKFYAGGQGGHIYGKGTYTGFGALGKQTASNYANANEHGQILEMILDKNARTITYYDLYKEVNKEVDEFIKNNYQKYNIDNYMKLITNLNKIEKEDEFMTYYVLNVMHDVGYNASIKRYDAIIADNELAKQKYIVVLNRSKVIIHE